MSFEIDSVFLVNVLDNLPVGISIISPTGQILYVNKTECYYLGYSRSELIAMTVDQMYRNGLTDKPLYSQVVKQKKALTSLKRTRRKDGSYMNFLMTQRPFFDENNNIKYIVSFERDIENEVKNYLLHKDLLSDNKQLTPPIEKASLIYESKQMQDILDFIEPVLKTNVPILLQGDTGTGKEVMAQYIHENSRRANKKMVCINCAALPDSLLESELFGYEKGAFSGASSAGKKGLFEEADGGTLFLDEINSLPLSLQPKLLRVLETNVVQRLGSVKGKSINFRLIVASNRSLEQCVRDGTFRLDLYYRINAIKVTIPPLCQRRDDIIPLANHFLVRYCRQYHCEKHFSNEVYASMYKYDWPGNVRELRNTIERLVLTTPPDKELITSFTETLETSYVLYPEINSTPQRITAYHEAESEHSLLTFWDSTLSLPQNLDIYERAIIQEALQAHKNAKNTAIALQIDQSTMSRKLVKYGMGKRNK